MSDFEQYSQELLLSSKLFLEESKTKTHSKADSQRMLRASLTHAFFFLEAQMNYLASHFVNSDGFDLMERSLLAEREIRLEKGLFVLSDSSKFYRLEDRIEFLLARFSKSLTQAKGEWYSELKVSLAVRNRLVHPREAHTISQAEVEKAIVAILNCLTALYQAIFQKDFPLSKLGLGTGPI